jgi:hypothetical protein
MIIPPYGLVGTKPVLTSLLLICLLLTFLLACLGTPRVWFESMLLICSRAALGMLFAGSALS